MAGKFKTLKGEEFLTRTKTARSFRFLVLTSVIRCNQRPPTNTKLHRDNFCAKILWGKKQ